MSRHKILFVDDDAQLLEAFERAYRSRYEVFMTERGGKALRLVKEHGPFAVVVADLRMPGMDGITLFKEMQLLFPETMRIMLTGCADLESALDAVNHGQVFRLLQKPCPEPVLSAAITDAIRHYQRHAPSLKKEEPDTGVQPAAEALADVSPEDSPGISSEVQDAAPEEPPFADAPQASSADGAPPADQVADWPEFRAVVSDIISLASSLTERSLAEDARAEAEVLRNKACTLLESLNNLPQWEAAPQEMDDQTPEVANGLEDTDMAEEDPVFAADPLDYDKALYLFKDDAPRLHEVLSAFLMKVRSKLVVLGEALASGDAETIFREAHSISKSATKLAAAPLAEAAARLEQCGKDGDMEDVPPLLDGVVLQFARLQRFIGPIMEQGPQG